MFPVQIDIFDVSQEFKLTFEQSDEMAYRLLDTIIDSFMRRWEENIDDSLHSTRAEYKRAIFREDVDKFSVVVGMTPRKSKLGLMLEEGASSFDIKQGMSVSEKRTQKPDGDGWFITIPFRWATSDAVAESMSFSNRMPKEIQKLVNKTPQPLALGDLPSEVLFNKQGIFEPYASNRTSGYVHKANIYEGLQRESIGSGQNENRGGYFTFRRISDKTDEKAWIHPGFEALKLMDKSIQEIDVPNIVDQEIDNFLNSL